MNNGVMFGFVLTAFCTDADGNVWTENYSSFGKGSSFKVSAGVNSGYWMAAKIDQPFNDAKALIKAKAWAKRRAKIIRDGDENSAKPKRAAKKK